MLQENNPQTPHAWWVYRVCTWHLVELAMNSLGLPRESTTKTPNLSSFQNTKQRYNRDYFASLRYIWRNQLLRAYWRHNKTKRGITGTVMSRYTSFWQKYDVCLNFQNAKNGILLISQPYYGTSASLRYIQRQQNQEGDIDVPFTVTIYRFMAKKVEVFYLSWF